MKELLYLGFALVGLAFGVLIIIIFLVSVGHFPVFNKENYFKRLVRNFRKIK